LELYLKIIWFFPFKSTFFKRAEAPFCIPKNLVSDSSDFTNSSHEREL
jgi:hypothetical protein